MSSSLLETERLVLRPVRREDFPVIVALMGDYDVVKNLSSAPHPYTFEDAEAFFIKQGESHWRGEAHVFAVIRKSDGAFLGKNGLHMKDGLFEMGYWLGKPYWGQGFATEAARRVAQFAFGKLQVERIGAGWFEGNDASGNVLAKLGFVPSAVEQRDCQARGHKASCNVMVLTSESFAIKDAA